MTTWYVYLRKPTRSEVIEAARSATRFLQEQDDKWVGDFEPPDYDEGTEEWIAKVPFSYREPCGCEHDKKPKRKVPCPGCGGKAVLLRHESRPERNVRKMQIRSYLRLDERDVD